MALMQKYNIPPPRWIGEVMPKITRQSVRATDPQKVLDDLKPAEFEEERKEAAVHLKPVKAVFIEEGKVGRQTRGISAQDIEYIVTDDGIENIAIVVPITRDWDNNLLVALEPKIMPVPNRLGGGGATLNAPSFPIPRDAKTLDEAKAFIASKFKVDPERVAQVGASFFTHVGVMPQRVYPFTVASAAEANTWGLRYMLESAIAAHVFLHHRHYSMGMSTLKTLATIHNRMVSEHDSGLKRDMSLRRHQGFELSTEKVAVEAINAGYSSVPSRVLGQRGSASTPGAVAPPIVVQVPQPSGPQQPGQQQAAAQGQSVTAGVQAQIDDLLTAPTGKRLSQSYAQAKIHVKATPGIVRLDKHITEIGKALPGQGQGQGQDGQGQPGEGQKQSEAFAAASAPGLPGDTKLPKSRGGGAAGGAGAGGGRGGGGGGKK
jgi:hypothetical protein